MSTPPPYLALDADDTLWHNEPLYQASQRRFRELLFDYHDPAWVEARLNETEIRNLKHFGYGVKGFTLSMIETAIELSEGRVTAAQVQSIIDMGREMLTQPIELLPGVRDAVSELAESYRLMLVTKGDLLDQESKLARSGLGEHFSAIEVVSEKDRETYLDLMRRYSIAPADFTMVGNSLKSDVLPVASLGAVAVHIPYKTTWVHERVTEGDLSGVTYQALESIADLPAWLQRTH
ncbi:MAG: HAD family hydrolase [Pseudomonadota bacterium]